MAESIINAYVWYFCIPPLCGVFVLQFLFLITFYLSHMADAAAAHDNNSVISIYSELTVVAAEHSHNNYFELCFKQ